jgi:hypothetical protein
MAQPQVSPTPAQRRSRHPGFWVAAAVLLAAALVAVLWVPFYDRTTPALANFPFFYWYQLLWIPIVAILGAFAYAVTRAAQRDTGKVTGPNAGPPGSSPGADPGRKGAQ